MEEPYDNLVTPYTELHLDRCALLVIDTQNDYGDPAGTFPVPGLEAVIPELVEVLEIFRSAGLPIVHVVRLYKEDASNVDPCRRWQFEQGELRIVIPGTWGSQLVASTNPTGAELDAEKLLAGELQELTSLEFVLYKPRFSAFHATRLEAFLRERDIDSVRCARFYSYDPRIHRPCLGGLRWYSRSRTRYVSKVLCRTRSGCPPGGHRVSSPRATRHP
jgi:nicotinamidase-related amidase